MESEKIDRHYTAWGGAAEFFRSEEKEVLCESGAGTGKSFSVMQRAKFLCLAYPGSRHVFARDTRRSLSESILPDFEEHVLWPGHPAIGKATRAHRGNYTWPNGSEIILHSLENVDRILSAQFDTISIFQAEELQDEEVWEKMTTRLRHGAIPAHLRKIIADVNPAAVTHWLNLRAERKICWPCSTGTGRPDGMPTIIEMDEEWGAPTCPLCKTKAWKYQMQRILYRHEDNPRWYDWKRKKWTSEGKDYIGNTLGRLTGVQRERLLKHRWVSESGVILDEWDPKTHILRATAYGPGDDPSDLACPYWRLHVHESGWDEPITLIRFGAGVDWGFYPDPGVISVWGYDDKGRRFLVEEVYRLRQQIEWWAQQADDLRKKYGIKYFACDPSRNDYIEAFNIRMTPRFGRSRPIAIRANNRLRAKARGAGKDLVGIDLMRWGLRDPDGKVRTFLLKETTPQGVDAELKRVKRPVCTSQEVSRWVYAKDSSGKDLETPSDKCDDHGLDTWRYEQSIGWLEPDRQEAAPRKRVGSIRSLLWDSY